MNSDEKDNGEVFPNNDRQGYEENNQEDNQGENTPEEDKNIESSGSEFSPSEVISEKNEPFKKFKRWGNPQDIHLFTLIHSDELKGFISLKEIKEIKVDYSIEENPILKKLKEQTGWKFSLEDLLDRIKRKNKDEFSKREEQKLKSIIKKNGYNPEYNQVHSKLPWKSIEAIKIACDAICREKRRKRISELDFNEELRKNGLI